MTRATTPVRISLVLLAAAPAVALRLTGVDLAPPVAALVYGVGVLAAAFLLMWAAETARADISGALALALLALIAVLPEYAVDLYLAYTAGSDPTYAGYAAANMTGANRLLIGIGWPLVVLAAVLGARKLTRSGRTTAPVRGVVLEPHRRIELAFLALAAVYAFVIPLTRQIAWYDTIVLVVIYGVYVWRIARGGAEGVEELTGVPEQLAALPTARRRGATIALFVAAGAVIAACAEPFANSLVEAGTDLGIDQFLLVQWLAPIASEAPELIVAVMFAFRGRGDDGIGALLSSKVNQWTLLVGSLPVAYFLGGGSAAGLSLDARQVEEVALTAAQTVLGLAILINLDFRRWEAVALTALFAVQFVLPGTSARLVLTAGYLVAGLALLVARRRHLAPTLRALVRTPSDDEAPAAQAARPAPRQGTGQ